MVYVGIANDMMNDYSKCHAITLYMAVKNDSKVIHTMRGMSVSYEISQPLWR